MGIWHPQKEHSLKRRRWRLTAALFAVAVLAAGLANHGPPDKDDHPGRRAAERVIAF
jgi:hypothetical protein